MGAIADLANPGGGAVAALPNPMAAQAVTPEELDIAGSATSGSFNSGLRAGFNQMAGGVHALVGNLSETLGLTDFAAARFAEADQYAKFADAIGPAVNDYRQVKDYTSLVDFVMGQFGQAAASSVPALLGGVGGGAALGLRGAYAGLAAGSFVPNAGEQAQNIRNLPGSPAAKTANALGVGAINAVGDVLPGGMVAKQILKPTSMGLRAAAKQAAKVTGAEALTEGAQDVVGQAGQMALDPSIKLDPHSVVNSALAGGIGGAGLGAAGHVASVAPGAISDATRAVASVIPKKSPREQLDEAVGAIPDVPDDSYDDLIKNADLKDRESILAAIDEKDEKSDSILTDIARRMGKTAADIEGIISDPDKRAAFLEPARKFVNDVRDAPQVRAAVKSVTEAMAATKQGYEGAKPKRSLQRTALDAQLLEVVKQRLPARSAANLTPEHLQEVVAAVKHAAMYSIGERRQVVGPGRPAYDADRNRREQDRGTVPEGLPTGLLSILGRDAVGTIQAAQDVLKANLSEGQVKGRPREAVAESVGRVKQRRSRLEAIVHEHLKPKYWNDPAARSVATEGIIRLLNDGESGTQFKKTADAIFEDPENAVRDIEAHEQNKDFAREFTLTATEVSNYEQPETPTAMAAAFDEANPAEEPQGVEDDSGLKRREQLDSVYNDTRLKTYDTAEEARQVMRDLNKPGEYDQRKVQFSHEPEVEYVDDGHGGFREQPTGRITIIAKDREAADSMSGVPAVKQRDGTWKGFGQWGEITDKSPSNQAGFEHGTITVKRKDGKTVRVSLKALTAMAMKYTDRPGDSATYVEDMVKRGLGMLLSDPMVESVHEKATLPALGEKQWDIPDGTVVAAWKGKDVTWGEVKEGIDPTALRDERLADSLVERAQRAETLDDIDTPLNTARGQLKALTKELDAHRKRLAKARENIKVYMPAKHKAVLEAKSAVEEADHVATRAVDRAKWAASQYKENENETTQKQWRAARADRDEAVLAYNQAVDAAERAEGAVKGAQAQNRRVYAMSETEYEAAKFERDQAREHKNAAKKRVGVFEGAVARIEDEQDRRKRDGDHPFMEIGTNNADQHMIDQKGTGEDKARTVDELGETTDGAQRVKSQAGALDTGVKPEARASQNAERYLEKEDGSRWEVVRLKNGRFRVDNAETMAVGKGTYRSREEAVDALMGRTADLGKPSRNSLSSPKDGQRQLTPAEATREDASEQRVANESSKDTVDGNMVIGHQPGPSYEPGPKKSLMSNRVHQEVGGDTGGGFAAAHDSPIKHEGKFDWRKNLGKGEGHAAYGAGTYLSTAEGVHKRYKGTFSEVAAPKIGKEDKAMLAEIDKEIDAERYVLGDITTTDEEVSAAKGRLEMARAKREKLHKAALNRPKKLTDRASPTYHVTVRATPDEILDWDKPLSEQPKKIQEAMESALPFNLQESLSVDKLDISKLPTAWQEGTKAAALSEYTVGGKRVRVYKLDRTSGDAIYNVGITHEGKETWGKYSSEEGALRRVRGLLTGGAAYEAIVRDQDAIGEGDKRSAQAAASDYLQSLGIVGHKYAAHGGRNERFPNYVIYDDSRIDTKFVEFSDVRANAATPVTAEQKAEIRAYVASVLGEERTKVLFKNLEHAGEFASIKGAEVLRIANLALDPMGTARHEAAHALFARLIKANPKAAQALLAAAGSPTMLTRLRTLLKDHPEALKQLSDPEERLAYMYQFWEHDAMTVGPKTQTWFDKVREFFRRLTDIWTGEFYDGENMDQAARIFDLFDRGALKNRDTVAEVLRDRLQKSAIDRADELMGPAGRAVKALLYSSVNDVRALNIPAFSGIADEMYTDTTKPGAKPGFNQAKHPPRNRFLSAWDRVSKGASEEDQRLALEALQGNTTPPAGKPAEIVAGLRPLLKEVFDYMKEARVRAVSWNDSAHKYDEHELQFVRDYFPRYYDKAAVATPAFQAMLRRNGFGSADARALADRIARSQVRSPNESDEEVGLTYYAPSTQARKLTIPAAELAPFLRKDLDGTVRSYIAFAVRRAEYARRFGNQGQAIKEAEKRGIEQEGATPEQVRVFNRAVQALEGSLGHDLNPTTKKIFEGVQTYQHLRLLPLALFSSLTVDPIGIVVRGGTVPQAFGAFARVVRGLVSESKDGAYDMAVAIGAISSAIDTHMLQEAYGVDDFSSMTSKVNSALFRWNGMDSLNRSMRVAATAAAHDFIVRHVTKPNKHSERMLAEIGLTKDDVKVTDGKLDLSNQKVRDAMNLWVDGAVLRPNAAIRPTFMSDPHWMLVSSLKQYMYAYQEVIIKRVVHEINAGNYTPAYALLSYVPAIIAADVLRASLTPGGGDDDAWKRMDFVDVLGRGIQRAGVTGPFGQYAMDTYGDVKHYNVPFASLGGPTIEQLANLAKAGAGAPGASLGHEAARAIPGYILVR